MTLYIAFVKMVWPSHIQRRFGSVLIELINTFYLLLEKPRACSVGSRGSLPLTWITVTIFNSFSNIRLSRCNQ